MKLTFIYKGGEGSGFHGHAGRPGEVGGSRSGINSDAFTKWFGDSKVVDANGKPLRVYHGTMSKEDFTEFRPKYSPSEQLGFGIHFAEKASFADLYASDKGGRVVPVYLRISKLLEADKIVAEGSEEYELAKKIARSNFTRFGLTNPDTGKREVYLQNIIDSVGPKVAEKHIRAAGYDGVKYKAMYGSRTFGGMQVENESMSYIVFDSKQIKSAIGNAGTYDPNDPDVMKELFG